MVVPVQTRKAIESDLSFVIPTWLNHYKHYSLFAKRIVNKVYHHWHYAIVKRILAKTSCEVYVAYNAEESDQALAFLVLEYLDSNPIIHFAFTKKDFRKMGIMKQLIAAANLHPPTLTFTHWTFDTNDIVRKYPSMIYNPYLL